MKRICHIQVLPLLTGVQRVMLDIFQQLDRERFEIHVVCKEHGPLTEELARADIRCHLLADLDRPVHPLRDARAYRQLAKLFADHDFDLVHTHSSKPGILGRIAARRAGVPAVVHHVHGFAFHEFSPTITRWVYSNLERVAGRYCDRVIFVNNEEREMAIDRGLLPADKCLTVYNGIDLERYATHARSADRMALRRRHGLGNDEIVVLMMGRLDRQKQPLLIPHIARELERLSPRTRWRLAVAGAGDQAAELAALVERLGVVHRVQLLGWQPEPEKLFGAVDIVLQPTLWEGLPLSLLGAHGASLPSVASDIKGNREVVTSQTGFLCEPHDPASYARALKRLIDDQALRTAQGIAARHRAEQHFDASTNYRRIADLYCDLLHLPYLNAPRRRAA